jgi:hypothetical protein
VVDVDHTLTTEDEEALWEKNNLDLQPRTGAAGALRVASGGSRIVYVSPGAGSASRYNKIRSWLNRGGRAQAERFPPGPLLAPMCGDEPAWLENLLRSFGQRFPGKHIGIAGRMLEARAFAASGFESYLVGRTEETVEDVHVGAGWKELSLPKPVK